MRQNKPTMYDNSMFTAAGFNLPGRYGNNVDQNGMILSPRLSSANLDYNDIYAIMQLQDLKEYAHRYQAVNIPLDSNLDQELMERILYYRGSAIFYYNEKVDKFQFLPYALNNIIDEYGRHTRCNTLPFTGVSENDQDNFIKANLEITYGEIIPASGVIIHDSMLGMGQKCTPRAVWVKPILHSLATCYMIINTTMYGAADMNVILVDDNDLMSVQAQLNTIPESILKGNRFLPVSSKLKIESLQTSKTASLQDIWEVFNSLDNFRKTTAGIENAGVFNKKERMLAQEQALNADVSAIYSDGLIARQKACYLINQVNGINMWYMEKGGVNQGEPEEDNEMEQNMKMEGSTDEI